MADEAPALPADDPSPDEAPRPPGCRAVALDGFAWCDRCGLAWRQGEPLTCEPMNVGRIRSTLVDEANALEGSHRTVVAMRDAGMPIDPIEALKRAAALRGVLLFVERCVGSSEIIAELQRIARRQQENAEREANRE